MHNQTFFGPRGGSKGAQPYLGEERLMTYVKNLTAYIGMLRAGFPETKFVAVHTMPQRNARRARPCLLWAQLLVRVRQCVHHMGLRRPNLAIMRLFIFDACCNGCGRHHDRQTVGLPVSYVRDNCVERARGEATPVSGSFCCCRALLAYEQVGGAKNADEALRLAAGHSQQLLWNGYIADVNAALRHVAAAEALTLLDYESVMLRLPTAHAHFMDGMHPLVRLDAGCRRLW